MLIDHLKTIYNRDLNRLKTEISSYENEAALWHTEKEITNCAGNLCLHLVGNLNAFIGAVFGSTGYVRQRDLEFSQKNIPQVTLIKMVDETIAMVDLALGKITEDQLEEEYPIKVLPQKMSNSFFLIYLTTHLNYHLGQINYHRRLLDK